MKTIKTILFTVIAIFVGVQTIWCEPSMSTYTCYPIAQVNTVEPNIMIILDNSGSMNYNAYGTFAGTGQTVTDAPYAGEPYQGRTGSLIRESSDDAFEELDNGYVSTTSSVCVAAYDSNYIGGLRFSNLNIPPGATIKKAYIVFKSAFTTPTDDLTSNITIVGEESSNAATFSGNAYNHDISSRPATTQSVTWTDTTGWTQNQIYQTPDIKSIVQEIVNQSGWAANNAMVFIFSGSGERVPYSYDYSKADSPYLYIEYTPATPVTYYGYFNPDYFYSWNSSSFVHAYKKISYDYTDGYWNVETLDGTATTLTNDQIVAQGLWDGNWMNWATMRRIDVLRKVLVGGKMTSRTGGGNQTVIGENSASDYTYIRNFDSSAGSAVTPYNGDYYYTISGGDIYVSTSASISNGYIVKDSLDVNEDVRYEPEDFDSNGDYLAGILQKIGNKARWANMWFNYGTGSNGSGGYVQNTMGDLSTNLITDLENQAANTWTPLAETLYTAVKYFEQEDPQSGLDYPNNAVPDANLGDDPYYDGTEFVPCAKSFVLLLTDGASSKDAMIPTFLKGYAGNSDDTACDETTDTNCDFPDGGTDFLKDVALYARTTDLRSATLGKTNLPGDQNLILYTVYAFGDDPNAEHLLMDAAKNGGFVDQNGNNRPDLQSEWDANGDGIPDTFFSASNGYQLESQILQAINDILKRAASGTAVSVLATSGEGEGTLVQAYYQPLVPSGLTNVKWVGHIQSLWVDSHGNLREDTDGDHTLNVDKDDIISFFLDTSTGDTRINKWLVSSTTPYPDTSTVPPDLTLDLDEIHPIWSGGEKLADRDPSLRNIFTFIDKNDNGKVDEPTNDPVDGSGEIISFSTSNAALISPYLGVKDDATWSYLGATQADRVTNLIKYIRGYDVPGLRTRTINGKVWKLGDIIHSTPVSVSSPPDNYQTIYGDQSYAAFYNEYKNRETVVYVGGNDGMLHAFTSGVYDESTKSFSMPTGVPTTFPATTTYSIGDELWAYIPQALLPHLKWLADPNYTHVYYADLKPKVFDAKIDVDNSGTPEWRTLLLLGLNFGGKQIDVTDDFDYNSTTPDTTRTFKPSYTLIDITNPRSPRVLWEKTYEDLQASSSLPAIVKVKDKWFAVFGSGPSDCDGTSSQTGKVFVVDLATGEPYTNSSGDDWLFQTAETNAFMNSPVSIDKDLNYNVDSIYFGETYSTNSGAWKGKLYKIEVPWVKNDGSGDYDGVDVNNYSDDPNDSDPNMAWKFYPLFDADVPITAPVALSVDSFDNVWVYVGSGRYFNTDDKTNTDQQYMFGIKDPFFNKDHSPSVDGTDYYHNYSANDELTMSDLLDSDPYIITENGDVLEDTNGDGIPDTLIGGWQDLLDLARSEDGWYRSLDLTGERILTKSAILGGIVFDPSFVPNQDVCGFGGDSYLYGEYFETGTSYYNPIFKNGTQLISYGGNEMTTVLDKTSIGAGKASSIGVHVGAEGSTGFIQTSTGTVIDKSLNPAFNVKSGLQSWIEK